MLFRIINHEKSHIIKGKGYICSNLKITTHEKQNIIYNRNCTGNTPIYLEIVLKIKDSLNCLKNL